MVSAALWGPPAHDGPRDDTELHQREVRRALDRHVAESLVPLTLGLGLLWMGFGVLDGFLAMRQPSLVLGVSDFVVGGAMLAVWARLRASPPRPGSAHAWMGGLALLLLADVMLVMALIPTPDISIFLLVYVIGVGALALSTPWLAAMLGGAAGAWAVFAAMRWSPAWITFGIGFSASIVLAFAFHLARQRAYARMESLRILESRRKAELEIREEALQGAVQAAQESEERYRRLVENAPDAFLVHSAGHIVYANAAAAKLFGATSIEGILGASISTLIDPASLPEVMARMALVESEGVTTPRMEIRMLRLDGRPVDVEIMGQPIVFAGQPADQTVIRDITDRKQVEQERALNAKRAAEIERLRELDRLKTQFVNTLSHELRTPLTPIKVQLHILKNAPPEGEGRKRAMDMLERNLTRLSGLVDEFLEVARIQSGSLKLTKQRVDVAPILKESLESFQDVAQANGVKLDVALDSGLWADVDPKRVTQVVFNLVGNAMKFTPRGGTIRVDAARRADAVTVRVQDTGVGLKAEDIAKLFEPFSQVHDTMQKTNAGTGLGLYICRGIAESHGGRIWCESDGPGKGATFAFSLPAADGPLTPEQAAALAAKSG